MKCKDCGHEAKDISAMNKHKREECPKRVIKASSDGDNVLTAEAAENARQAMRATPGVVITPDRTVVHSGFIPFANLPPEARILSPGQSLRLKVFARLTADGAIIETAEFWR